MKTQADSTRDGGETASEREEIEQAPAVRSPGLDDADLSAAASGRDATCCADDDVLDIVSLFDDQSVLHFLLGPLDHPKKKWRERLRPVVIRAEERTTGAAGRKCADKDQPVVAQ